MIKKRFVIVGTGVRACCFARPLLSGEYCGAAELVAVMDVNPLRMEGFNHLLDASIPAYADWDQMIGERHPTHAIICTPDALHHEHIAKALAAGMDVITEKPMTTDAEKARFILDQERRSGRRVTVAFNYRFGPYAAKIRELIRDGRLGRILSVTLEWFLDTSHGAEYFRRWHARMRNSGGLLVHKATHHFDLVNWFLDDQPEQVAAFGNLMVYGRNGPVRGERCATCAHAAGACPYPMRTHKEPAHKAIFDRLYWEAEKADGYIRDACLFRNEIDIYDTMNVLVRYRRGAQLAYSLCAYSPSEGYSISLVGTKGRIEAAERHSGLMLHTADKDQEIRLITATRPGDAKVERIPVPVDSGEHGGGDRRMFKHLFEDGCPDPLGQMADSRAGAMSCLIGSAANRAIEEHRIVNIPELPPG